MVFVRFTNSLDFVYFNCEMHRVIVIYVFRFLLGAKRILTTHVWADRMLRWVGSLHTYYHLDFLISCSIKLAMIITWKNGHLHQEIFFTTHG